jgi:pyridinium-3,5-biscarboxylic acid mononucleotide sulfurtransferase
MNEDRAARLRSLLRGNGDSGLAVAFSGGVDSSLLAYLAAKELGERSVAITVVSPFLAKRDLAEARSFCARHGIRLSEVESAEIEEEVAANPMDRCYHCKKQEFGRVIAEARRLGFSRVAEGTNLDDGKDYRPGARAVAELRVESPLREAGFGKADIRDLAKRLGLEVWDKPAAACLASRLPYGRRITAEGLSRIEAAEDILRDSGFRQLRVRDHGEIARVEVGRDERSRFLEAGLMDSVAASIKALGYRYVCLDLAGYSMGSLNPEAKA